MTHFIKAKNKEHYDSIKDENCQLIRMKMLPKVGDEIVFEHVTGKEVEQKSTVISDITGGEGLMKGWYLVRHEMKGGGK